MKFLHLADLHIGKNVNGFPMLGEQRHIFDQIIGYIQAERPDAVVIAGDVYDRAAPGVEAVRAFDELLTRLAGERVAVLVIAGNHDAPERLSYASRLLQDKNLHLCGSFNGQMLPVALPDEFGVVNFWPLPFIKPAALRALSSDALNSNADTPAAAYHEIENFQEAVAAALATANVDDAARNVLLSHQFYTAAGVTPQRAESELSPVGGLDAIAIDAELAELLAPFDYVALGHLHGPQSVGHPHIRYAGSPLKYSFSEWRQEKSVTLVELKAKGDLTIGTLPLKPMHDMREIKGPIDALLSDAVVAQGDREDYLRVILTDEEELIDPMGKIRSVYPNVMALDFANSRTGVDLAAISAEAASAPRLSPYDLFGEFFLKLSGAVMSAEQEKLAREFFESADGAAEEGHETA